MSVYIHQKLIKLCTSSLRLSLKVLPPLKILFTKVTHAYFMKHYQIKVSKNKKIDMTCNPTPQKGTCLHCDVCPSHCSVFYMKHTLWIRAGRPVALDFLRNSILRAYVKGSLQLLLKGFIC